MEPNKVLPQHLCLLMHCLRRSPAERILAHRELFIDLSEVERLIRALQGQGYRFVLPGDASASQGQTCSLTFDDGYYNNSYILELAECYQIPLILFVSSYNIVHRMPFIWDIWDVRCRGKWRFSTADYEALYEGVTPQERLALGSDSHRPFTAEELKVFASCAHVYLASHTHTHQPLVGRYCDRMSKELDLSSQFLGTFQKFLPDEFSLPCGLYTSATKKQLSQRFRRIYTIDGGGFLPGAREISRISLVNTDIGGDLMTQIIRACHRMAQLRRKLINIRYSHKLLCHF